MVLYGRLNWLPHQSLKSDKLSQGVLLYNKYDCRPCVCCILFESKAEQSKFLVGDCVEHRMDDMICEASFLILIHFNYLQTNTSALTFMQPLQLILVTVKNCYQ